MDSDQIDEEQLETAYHFRGIHLFRWCFRSHSHPLLVTNLTPSQGVVAVPRAGEGGAGNVQRENETGKAALHLTHLLQTSQIMESIHNINPIHTVELTPYTLNTQCVHQH